LLNNISSEYLFPTQVASGNINDFDTFKQDLIDWIYAYKEKHEGISRISNRGGWQSQSKEVFTDKEFEPFKNKIIPCITDLCDEFHVFRRMDLVQMWINVNGPHSYNVSHRHPGCQLAGVLWVKQTPESGRFVFDNMDVGYRDAMLITATDRDFLEEKKMPPEYVPKYQDGTLIMFPAGLSHRVEINETKEDRLSLSFNIKVI
tara:strand:+ start:204 stop:812 length:609 start_codon:yes stop_codon:yes gene_type:complete